MNANHYDAERLRQLRAQKSEQEQVELTQAAVADALGVRRQTIYRAEAGQDISYEMLCALALYYGVPVVSLLHAEPLDWPKAA